MPAPKRTSPQVDYRAEDALSPEERLEALAELLATVAVRVWKAERQSRSQPAVEKEPIPMKEA